MPSLFLWRDLFKTRTPSASASASNAAAFALALIRGTDVSGNTFEANATIVDGNIEFDDVPSGDYEVIIPANPFIQGGETEQRIAVSATPGDGARTVTATRGRLRPEFLGIGDFVGSKPRNSILVALDLASAPGSTLSMLTAPETVRTAASVENLVASIESSTGTIPDRIRLRGTDPNASGGVVQTEVAIDNASAVTARGQAGSMRLYRINLDSVGSFASVGGSTGGSGSVIVGDGTTNNDATAGGGGSGAAGTALAGSDAANGNDTGGNGIPDFALNGEGELINDLDRIDRTIETLGAQSPTVQDVGVDWSGTFSDVNDPVPPSSVPSLGTGETTVDPITNDVALDEFLDGSIDG